MEQLRSDGGPYLDVLDLGKGDLDLAVGGEKGKDLSIETELGDEYQRAEPADKCDGKSQEGDEPESERKKSQESPVFRMHIRYKV